MSLTNLRSWPLERKLGLLTLTLGLGSLFGNPYRGGEQLTLDARELARVVQTTVDHVGAAELADWILAGRTDLRLLDLRDAADYAAYHIPGAEHAPITALADLPIARNETIVLVSDGGIHAAQAWFLLTARGFAGAKMLLGGFDAWQEEVLFPLLPADASPEVTAAFARRREIAAHFGGTPRQALPGEPTTTALALPSPSLPTVVAPASPTGAPVAAKKKKKEGC
jgi:rhodanese-related sulfurtransferase